MGKARVVGRAFGSPAVLVGQVNGPLAEWPPLRGQGARADLAFVTQAGPWMPGATGGKIPEALHVRDITDTAARLSPR